MYMVFHVIECMRNGIYQVLLLSTWVPTRLITSPVWNKETGCVSWVNSSVAAGTFVGVGEKGGDGWGCGDTYHLVMY